VPLFQEFAFRFRQRGVGSVVWLQAFWECDCALRSAPNRNRMIAMRFARSPVSEKAGFFYKPTPCHRVRLEARVIAIVIRRHKDSTPTLKLTIWGSCRNSTLAVSSGTTLRRKSESLFGTFSTGKWINASGLGKAAGLGGAIALVGKVSLITGLVFKIQWCIFRNVSFDPISLALVRLPQFNFYINCLKKIISVRSPRCGCKCFCILFRW